MDTLDQGIVPGLRCTQFAARDCVSGFDVLQAFTSATSHCAVQFLSTPHERLPFPIQAIQIDGGSGFMGEFEEECKTRSISMFVLPPRSSKLNACTDIEMHNQQLERWSRSITTSARTKRWEI